MHLLATLNGLHLLREKKRRGDGDGGDRRGTGGRDGGGLDPNILNACMKFAINKINNKKKERYYVLFLLGQLTQVDGRDLLMGKDRLRRK